ncbi:hypothetical protein Tco_1370896 [Tanacetum coccineum]
MEEADHEIEVAHMDNNPFVEFPILEPSSEEYSTQVAKIPEKQVENGVVELYFVRTEYELADIFTKPLARERLKFLIKKLRVQSMSPETLKKLAYEEEE